MEYLLGEIVKIGGDRRFLKAKIFGAGYLDGAAISADASYSDGTIRFINEYFAIEKINVERYDLGGEFRRKIYFDHMGGQVYRQVLKHNEDSSEFIKLEKEYIDREFRNKKHTGKVILFE
jgi:chemotaxis receptor (MCP) glutamine deamidase CheD